MKRVILFALVLLFPVAGNAQPPATTSFPLKADANGNVLPATINGNPLNLPANTTLGGAAIGGANDTAFASSWNGITTTAPSKNAIYDWAHIFDTDDDGKVNVLDTTAGLIKTDANGVATVATAGTDYVASLAGLLIKTARVDVVGGNNTTGTIGDYSKPFLTVQGAINAIQTASPGDGAGYLIDVGNSGDASTVTTSLTNVAFISSSFDGGRVCNVLNFTETTNGIILSLLNSNGPIVNTVTTGLTDIRVNGGKVDDVVATNGGLYVSSLIGSGVLEGHATAGGNMSIFVPIVGGSVLLTVTEADSVVQLFNATPLSVTEPEGEYYLPSIVAPDCVVWLTNSFIQDITSSALHLKDSRVLGTNSASSTVYDDDFLAGDDTAYDATSWDSKTRTPTKNAVRDKFEALGDPITPNHGGTGVANNAAATLTRVGNHAVIVRTSGATDVTWPTTGTLATTAQVPSIASTTNILIGDGAGNAADSLLAITRVGSNAFKFTDQNESTDLTIQGTDNASLDIGAGGTLGTAAFVTLGTGVGTALAVNVGSAGAFTTNNAANIFSVNGAASTPAVKITGVPWSGNATTSFPLFYINDANATASTTFNTAGTYFGVNGDGTQDLMNLLKDGVSVFKVSSGGVATGAGLVGTGSVSSGDYFAGVRYGFSGGRSWITCGADGLVALQNNGTNGFTRLQFGLTTNSAAAIGFDAVNGFTLQSAAGTATWNDASTAASGTVANRYLFGIAAPTLTATNATTVNTVASTFYIGGAPVTGDDLTITTAYALNVAAGNSLFGGALIVGQIGAEPVPPSNTTAIYSIDGGGTAEGYWADEAGNETLQTPHANDAPAWLYDDDPGVEHVTRSVQRYAGTVTYHNITRQGKLLELPTTSNLPLEKKRSVHTETFAEYKTRTGKILTQLDWDTVQETHKKVRDSQIAGWTLAKKEADKARSDWAKLKPKEKGETPEPPEFTEPKPQPFKKKNLPTFLAKRLKK